MEKKINIQQTLLFSFVKNKPKTSKKVVSICSLIMVLIKMRLLIFLVLSRYGSACKYGIISQTSIYNWIQNWFSDTWNNNWQSGKAKRDTWFSLLFKKKMFLVFFFLIEYVLKIKYNLCLFALSWLEIEHKTRHYRGENSYIFYFYS